jgi:hypothetical protein
MTIINAGHGVPDLHLHEAIQRLLQSELDLAESIADRITAFERQLLIAWDLEQIEKTKRENGTGTEGTYFEAKLFRLDAELQLIKAKAAKDQNAKEKSATGSRAK